MYADQAFIELPVIEATRAEPAGNQWHDSNPAETTPYEDRIGPFSDVFCIPHEDQYIIYLPLRGIIMQGNAQLVNRLYKARLGDADALAELGTTEAFMDELFESKKALERLTRPKELPPFAPTSVTLFLTNECTLRCKYCYANGGETTSGKTALQMPWDMVTGVLGEVLDNVRAAGLSHMTVIFHGGGDVASAWPLLKRTVGYLREITAPYGITVGTSMGLAGVLNRKQRAWIIEHIDAATVSIDGPPDIHDFQRPLPNGGPSFALVRETLKTFDAAGFPYGIRCTLTEQSVHRLEEIVTCFCQEFGARHIQVEPMFPHGRALNADLTSPDALAFIEYFRKARRVARDLGRDLSYSGARLGVVTNVFCQAAGESCAVTPNGIITSCYETLDANDPLASLFMYGYYDAKVRRMVVDDERRKRLYGLTVQNKPYCSKCFCKWHCAGDCAAKASREGGMLHPQAPDRCHINRELTKDQLLEALSAWDMQEA